MLIHFNQRHLNLLGLSTEKVKKDEIVKIILVSANTQKELILCTVPCQIICMCYLHPQKFLA